MLDQGGHVGGGRGAGGIDRDVLPGVVDGGFPGGIHLEFQPAQLFAITADADQDAAVLHEGLEQSGVDVAGNHHRDFGGAGEKLELFPSRDVPQQDDEIALALQLSGELARGGEHGRGVPLLH